MYPLDPAPWVWGVMLFNGLLWPHLAYLWARRAKAAYHAEHRNLLIDAFMGGFWVAAMQFNPLPSATTLSMMAMNNVAIGGLRFLLVGSVAQLLGVCVGWLIFHPILIPETSQLQLYACLPLIAAAAMDALRDRFAILGYEQNPSLKVSLSIGLAAFDVRHADATLWLNDADQALYEAKTTG
eukprot:gene4776-4676_t